MKNKDLIAYLQGFDDDMEVWVYNLADLEEFTPREPHIQHDYEEKRDVIVIPIAYRNDGN